MPEPIFIETIRVFNGQLSNLDFHNQRLNRTRKSHFETKSTWNLTELIAIPPSVQQGVYKCRMTYGEVIEKIEFEAYQPRVVERLRLIHNDFIEYGFKYQDRSILNQLFAQRGDADDVLIVKNNLVTDTSYANLVFWNGSQWHTPTNCLLAGTQRARLLEAKMIFEKKIRAQDLPKYAYARLINSMLDFETTPSILVENIK